jgi:hypothetical protein
MTSIKAMRTAVAGENSFIVDVAVVLIGLKTGWQLRLLGNAKVN